MCFFTKKKTHLPGRGVGCKALDEESHEDDEADTHEKYSVPVCLKINQKVLHYLQKSGLK